jgi:hypothetical protein
VAGRGEGARAGESVTGPASQSAASAACCARWAFWRRVVLKPRVQINKEAVGSESAIARSQGVAASRN